MNIAKMQHFSEKGKLGGRSQQTDSFGRNVDLGSQRGGRKVVKKEKPNAPCSCGSGKKHKKCCMNK